MRTQFGLLTLTLFLATMLSTACADDKENSYQPSFISGPVPGEEEDDGFIENLPPMLSPENYTPSLRPRLYKPILVEYSTASSGTWRTMKTRVLTGLADFMPDYRSAVYKQSVNKYGSALNRPRQAATGHFYVKQIDGRWWVIDPEGYQRYERSVTSVRKGDSARNISAWNTKYGTDAKWMADIQAEMAALGIHGTGAFCSNTYTTIQAHNAAHPEAPMSLSPSFGVINNFRVQKGLAYPGGVSTNVIGLVFYDGWEQFCKDYLNYELTPYKTDPNILGFYSDNEIDFSSLNVRMLDRFLAIADHNDPAYLAAKGFMDGKGATTVTDDLNSQFSGVVAEKYYKAVKEARDQIAPGIMYLGSRLHGTPKYLEGVIRAAGKYCDVISINYYSRWSPELTDWIPKWAEWAPNAPFLVTEFYTKALDNDLSNASGAGFAVRTERDKAYAFQHFALGLLEARNCIGWQWFRYQDEDYPDASNEPSNKGLYDNYYELYPYLSVYMKRFNYNVYRLADHFDGK